MRQAAETGHGGKEEEVNGYLHSVDLVPLLFVITSTICEHGVDGHYFYMVLVMEDIAVEVAKL